MKLIEFEKIAKLLGKEHKIHIKEGNKWASNIKTREIYYTKEDIYTLPEEHILGLLLHEVAHIHYTTDVKIPEKNKELIHSTINLLEDIAIEYIISFDYPNAGEILDSTRTDALDKLISVLPKLDASIYEKALYYAAARFNDRGYAIGIAEYEKIGNQIAEIMKQENQNIYNRKKTKDLIPLARKIVDLIIKEAGEPTEDQKRKLASDTMHGTADPTTRDPTQQKIIDALKQNQKGWLLDPTSNNLKNIISFIDEISDQAAIVGRKLRSILKRNNSMEFGGRYRTGKILTKRLTKTKISKDRRPFARRIVKSNQSYAFAIAADVSSSMQQNIKKNPISYALSSMYMTAEALRLAAIPKALIIFGTEAATISPLSKKPIPWQMFINEEKMEETSYGGTDIGKAITKCTEELQKAQAERKIMIILTDGSSDENDMKDAHEKAIKKDIECIGITISDDQRDIEIMDTVFSPEKNIKIHDTRNTALIGQAFIDVLKRTITLSP